MLQLHRITARCRQIGGIIEAHRHPAVDQLAVQEPQSRGNELVHIDRFVFDVAFFQHAAETMDHFSGALIFRDYVIKYVADF